MKKILLTNKVETTQKTFNIRRMFGLKESHCARYARLQAESLFGKVFPQANAWDLIYKCDSQDFNVEKLTPGDVVLCRNEKSRFSDRIDIKGNNVDLTHAILYLGIGKESNKEIFIHQYRKEQEIMTLDDLYNRGIYPKLILYPKNN